MKRHHRKTSPENIIPKDVERIQKILKDSKMLSKIPKDF